eukprot:7253202-Prorocentrum_lima.AAC.1
MGKAKGPRRGTRRKPCASSSSEGHAWQSLAHIYTPNSDGVSPRNRLTAVMLSQRALMGAAGFPQPQGDNLPVGVGMVLRMKETTFV